MIVFVLLSLLLSPRVAGQPPCITQPGFVYTCTTTVYPPRIARVR
jgi:hypothetical protein